MKVYWIVVVASVISIDWNRPAVEANPLNNQTRGKWRVHPTSSNQSSKMLLVDTENERDGSVRL